MEKLNKYRIWFLAAAIYNAVWGAIAGLFPDQYFKILGIPPMNYPPIFQGMGMIVGVYAIAYYMIYRDPARFGPFVIVGLIGKILGPLGYVASALRGDLPWSFGWINLTNDVVWLPAFIGFTIQMVKFELRKSNEENPT